MKLIRPKNSRRFTLSHVLIVCSLSFSDNSKVLGSTHLSLVAHAAGCTAITLRASLWLTISRHPHCLKYRKKSTVNKIQETKPKTTAMLILLHFSHFTPLEKESPNSMASSKSRVDGTNSRTAMINVYIDSKMFQVLVDEVIFFSMLKTSTTNKVKFRKSVTAVESRKKRFAPVVLAITLIKCSNAAKPVARLTI